MEDTIQRPCSPLCLLTPARNVCGPPLARLTPPHLLSRPSHSNAQEGAPGAPDRPHHPWTNTLLMLWGTSHPEPSLEPLGRPTLAPRNLHSEHVLSAQAPPMGFPLSPHCPHPHPPRWALSFQPVHTSPLELWGESGAGKFAC